MAQYDAETAANDKLNLYRNVQMYLLHKNEIEPLEVDLLGITSDVQSVSQLSNNLKSLEHVVVNSII